MAYEGDYNDSIFKKYAHIHEEILMQVNIDDKAKRDVNIAKEMQEVLFKVKNLDTYKPTIIEEKLFMEQARLLIDQSFAILNAGRSRRGQLEANKLFYRSHKGVSTAYGGDDIFEEELAAFFTALEATATNTTIFINDKLINKQQANVKVEQIEDELLDDTVVRGIRNVTTKLQGMYGRPNKKGEMVYPKIYSNPVFREGKIDVRGTSTIEVEADINPIIKKMFELFKGKNFSVKNYKSKIFNRSEKTYKNDYSDLRLGETVYYKAIYGTLSFLGYHKRYIDKVFYSSLYEIYMNHNRYVDTHFYDLRFVYDLRGVGLYDIDGMPISEVDFLIYNDPTSSGIYVQSTAELIRRELGRTRVGRFASEPSIARSYFTS